MRDDLGAEVPMKAPARRVVSLVPSLTEAIAVTCPGRLVGATDWCTHPAGLDIARVRGTKNPDLRAIERLRPDLVVANQEENRQLDVHRLRERGFAVWVTRIDTVAEALTSMGRLLGEALGVGTVRWLREAERVWDAPPLLPEHRVAVPVWRDPWMWVGPDTYVHDVLHRLGLRNVVHERRYPHADVAEVRALVPDLILLPDEPYPFSHSDGPDALAPLPSVPVPGRALSWYGPAMVTARAQVEHLIRESDLRAPGTGLG